MNDSQIHEAIEELVHTEQQLREGPDAGEHAAQLKEVEVQLDRCWDLLRQRQARKDAGLNPDDASVRSAGQVEGYIQ